MRLVLNMTSPIDEAMRDFATKSLKNEAGSMICFDKAEHMWKYNKISDEVYCMNCGGVDISYRGMAITLIEVKKLLERLVRRPL